MKPEVTRVREGTWPDRIDFLGEAGSYRPSFDSEAFNTFEKRVKKVRNFEHETHDMLKPSYIIPSLPPPGVHETPEVLRAAAQAHRYLGLLNGRATSIPNQGILIDTLSLQEAKASSEIENIVTTQDELFKFGLLLDGAGSPAAKEVASYRDALKQGNDRLRRNQGLLTKNTIIAMFRILKRTTEGFRSTPGTALKNQATGELVYVPPQDKDAIEAHMTALERFINDDEMSALDPLVKMAIIHHQFESIHPFSDGNGRIGRILNVLYLTHTGLLELPILYLSRYITRHKADYYRRLQAVRDDGAWEPWLLYMLTAVEKTARDTLDLIEGIRELMASYKRQLRDDYPTLYSQDFLNNLFRHPYTRIDFVREELGVTRQTAARYLDRLAAGGLLEKRQMGRQNYYVNMPLLLLFMKVSEQ